MAKPNGKWYRHKGKNFEYYTVDPISLKKYFYVGEGNHKPSPREALELLTKIKDEEKNITYGPEPISEGLYFINQVDLSKECELPAGTYQYMEGSYNVPDRLVPITFRKDGFVKFGNVYDAVLKDIQAFLSKESVYRDLNVIYKRGLLLYGPPGEGKTSLIRSIVHNELPPDAVVIIFDKSIPDPTFLNVMKDTLAERTKLFIFEELTDFIKRDNMEDLLTFLDGEFSIDKSLIIATTNYPEKLPGNIVERPSRFDKLYKVGNPNANQRKLILEHYLKRESTQKEVDSTAKLSTAAIKEVVLLSRLQDVSIEEAIEAMKKHSEVVKKNFEEDRGRMGL